METKTSKGKEIRIPGPDHPITISPAEGKVRVVVAGRIVAESTRALRFEEKGYSPVTTCRAAMPICRCSFESSITGIVRTRAIVRITVFRSGDRNRKMPVWTHLFYVSTPASVAGPIIEGLGAERLNLPRT